MRPIAKSESRSAYTSQVALRQPVRQAISQDPQRLAHLRFYRLHRDAQRVGDLGVSQPLRTAQLEHFAATGWQLFDCRLQCHVQLTLTDAGIGVGRGGRFRAEQRLGLPPCTGVTNLVQGAITDGAEQICTKRGLNSDGGASAPQLQHDLLRSLLGGGPLSEQGLGRPDHACVVGAEDRVERVVTAALELLDEFAVSQNGGLECSRLG
jgi:hypothetical protein